MCLWDKVYFWNIGNWAHFIGGRKAGGRVSETVGTPRRRFLCVGRASLVTLGTRGRSWSGTWNGRGCFRCFVFPVGGGGGCGGRDLGTAWWVGEGVRSRLRLVARSRHYAGRHFLSDPGEERCGAST